MEQKAAKFCYTRLCYPTAGNKFHLGAFTFTRLTLYLKRMG